MGECWATVFATAISHQVLARMNHHVVECRWHDEEAGDKMRKRHGEAVDRGVCVQRWCARYGEGKRHGEAVPGPRESS